MHPCNLQVRESLDVGIGKKDVPLAEILLCVGFFLSYFIEEVVHFVSDQKLAHNSENCLQPGHEQGLDVHKVFSVHSGACDVREGEQCIAPFNSMPKGSEVALPIASSPSYKTFPGDSHENGHNHMETSPDSDHTTEHLSSVKNLLTVVALSSHAVFEGLAVGLAETANSVWTLFIGECVFFWMPTL